MDSTSRSRSGRFRGGHATNAARGFTLLEVMVALAIVALGMMAVHAQLNRYAVGAAIIENKVLASWIASNRIAAPH